MTPHVVRGCDQIVSRSGCRRDGVDVEVELQGQGCTRTRETAERGALHLHALDTETSL